MSSRKTTLPLALAAFLGASPALAHEKWFLESSGYPLRWDLFFRPEPLAILAGTILLAAVAWLIWRARGGRSLLPGPETFGATPEHRAALYGLVPAILAVHLAVPLLVSGVSGTLFSSNNALPGVWTYLLGLVQTGIALAFFYGGFTRAAGVVLAVTWLLGVLITGIEPMLENVQVLAFAAFFWLAGRGPVSVDRLLFPNLEPRVRHMRHAVTALRIGTGASLVVLAFTEKLANQPLALGFLRQYPLNFTSALGLGLDNETFVLLAGAVELLAGLLIMFGIFTREAILVAWVPFNLTLTIFTWSELVGHLPFYGAMAVLLVWERGEENLDLWLDGLRRGPLAINRPAGVLRDPRHTPEN